MSDTVLVLGTRTTPLAIAQSEIVATRLRTQGSEVELRPMSSSGDRSLGGSLSPGKGVFTAELSRALAQREIDLVVHSLKDLPIDNEIVEGAELVLTAIPPRAAPHDLLLLRPNLQIDGQTGEGCDSIWRPLDSLLAPVGPSTERKRHRDTDAPGTRTRPAHDAFAELPRGALVGTSSPRRQAGALAVRADLICVAVRGSIGRRLEWLRAAACDALILAEAGLARLPRDSAAGELFEDLRAVRLDLHSWPCAPGQGALAVQVLRDGPWDKHPAILALEDPLTRREVEVERELLHRLGGGCQVPFAACVHDGVLTATSVTDAWACDAAAGMPPQIVDLGAGMESDAADIVEVAASRIAAGLQRRPTASLNVAPAEALANTPHLVVTSAETGARRLTRQLPRELPVASFPCTEVVALEHDWPSPESELVGPRRTWPWVLVGSPRAALQLVERSQFETSWLRLPWCALGEGTARELLGLGVPPNLVAKARNADDFAEYLLANLGPDNRLYLPRSARAPDRLARRLRAGGRTVHEWNAYDVVRKQHLSWPSAWDRSPERVLFTSGSHVEAFGLSGLALPDECWALGRPTAAALQQLFGGGARAGREQQPEVLIATTPDSAGVLELWNRSTVRTGRQATL